MIDKTYQGTINPQDCYNGLNNLKKAGVHVELTPEQAEEIYKCSQDFEYFLENYVQILSLDMGTVPFKPFDYQRRAMKKIVGNRFTILRWPRQMGKTTTVAAVLLWYAIFNRKYNIYVLAQQRGQAMEILDRIKEMYELLPWWFQPGVHSWNKGSIQLGNKSKIVSAATGGSGVRGKSVNLLYLDEFAWVENDVEFYTATYPVVSSGSTSKIIITSTPNGMNLFYKLWTEAQRGENAYVWDDALWYEHPARDKDWYDQQMANMSERQFNQEFLCEFQGSSDTLLSPNVLQRLTFQQPIRLVGDQKDFKVYEDPKPGHNYVLTADVSEGVGKDFSVVSVIDVTEAPYKQVVMMRSNIMSPLLLADLIDKTGKKYNEAYVIVESNTYGKQVVDALWMDYEYENLLLSRSSSNDAKLSGARNEKITPGVKTTKTTKRLGCSNLKGLIEANQLIIQDYDTVQELNSFAKKGTSYEAEKGKTDDIVMTLVIFAWFAAQPYFEDTFDQNTRDIIRQNILQEAEYHTAFGFMDDGMDDEFGSSAELFGSFH